MKTKKLNKILNYNDNNERNLIFISQKKSVTEKRPNFISYLPVAIEHKL